MYYYNYLVRVQNVVLFGNLRRNPAPSPSVLIANFQPLFCVLKLLYTLVWGGGGGGKTLPPGIHMNIIFFFQLIKWTNKSRCSLRAKRLIWFLMLGCFSGRTTNTLNPCCVRPSWNSLPWLRTPLLVLWKILYLVILFVVIWYIIFTTSHIIVSTLLLYRH